jgi:hypothetical protein
VVTNADAGEVVSGLAAGDVTGDARADFVLVSETNGLVGYVRGVGDLTYAARQALTPFDNARAVVMEDFDGDGLDEVLVTANDGTDGAPRSTRGRARATPSRAPSSMPPAPPAPASRWATWTATETRTRRSRAAPTAWCS